jgi:hypothetical protein
VRGEANGDGKVDLSDAVFLLQHLFLGGPAPKCQDAADINDSGAVDLSSSSSSWRFVTTQLLSSASLHESVGESRLTCK